VTDANLVRGLLDPGNFLGGRIRLDVVAAQRAIAPLAKALGTDALAAAEGITRVVNTNMAEGIKLVSVRRRCGSAGLHAGRLRRRRRVARHRRRAAAGDPSRDRAELAAVLSAWGMLATGPALRARALAT
jgi:N-methylhydantoinase A